MLPELDCNKDAVWSVDKGDAAADHVVMLLHGMQGRPESLDDLTESVLNSAMDRGERVRVLLPTLPLDSLGSTDLAAMCREIATELRDTIAAMGAGRVTLIGHSTGGPLVQAVFLYLEEDAEFKIPAENIRLVLLSSLNNGWTLNHSMPPQTKVAFSFGAALAVFMKFIALVVRWATGKPTRAPWILQIRRGSPFLIDIQLRWLALRDRIMLENDNTAGLPKVVQVLGSRDELISWSDSISISSVGSFEFVNMPHTDHLSAISFNDANNPEYGAERRAVFEHAVWSHDDSLAIDPWDEIPPAPELQVERVVFVVHGIRDEGHWTQKIGLRARKIYDDGAKGVASRADETRARQDRPDKTDKPASKIAIITSGYGFFSMLQFLNPFERLKKVHWFVHHYVEARRRYPKAKFSFIGHSNGTYLLAKSLMLYDRVRFERIVFAGSVVTQAFPWEKFLNPGLEQPADEDTAQRPRTKAVLNFAADGDWVVALFPMIGDWPLVRRLVPGLLGGVGVGRFSSEAGEDRIIQRQFVRGGLGAAIQERYWDDLARFVVNGDAPSPDALDTANEPRWYVTSKAFRGLVLLAIGVVALGYIPWIALNYPVWFWVAAIVPLGLALVALVVTRLIVHARTSTSYPNMGMPNSIMAGTFAITGVAWLTLPWWGDGAQISGDSAETVARTTISLVQGLSVLGYFALVNRVLTRV